MAAIPRGSPDRSGPDMVTTLHLPLSPEYVPLSLELFFSFQRFRQCGFAQLFYKLISGPVPLDILAARAPFRRLSKQRFSSLHPKISIKMLDQRHMLVSFE